MKIETKLDAWFVFVVIVAVLGALALLYFHRNPEGELPEAHTFPEFAMVEAGNVAGATGTTLRMRDPANFTDDMLVGMLVTVPDPGWGAQQRVIIGQRGDTLIVMPSWTRVPTTADVYWVSIKVER